MRHDHRLILTAGDKHDSRLAVRGTARGELVRIKRGAFVLARDWAAASAAERQRLRAAAYATSHSGLVFSHHTSAAVHGIPVVDEGSELVHATTIRGHSEPGLVVHRARLGSDDVVEIGGLLVTSVIRTLADLAAEQRYRFAMVPLDHCLRLKMVERTDLDGRAEALRGTRGCRKVVRAFGGADGRAESPGESVSRGAMDEWGFPSPDLQVSFGRERVDFDWPEHGIIGEFDGRLKYGMSPGEAPEQVLWREKRREDGLRLRTGRRFARWLWPDAYGGVGLRVILLEAGLPITRRRIVDA